MTTETYPGGTYRIQCGPYFYFGSTHKFTARRYAHHLQLRKGIHFNPRLQKAFDEHNDFQFHVHHRLPEDAPRLPLEQELIRAHRDSDFLCNDPKGNHMDDATFKQLVANAPDRYLRGAAARARIAESKRGSKNPNARPVVLIYPKGNTKEFPTATACARFLNVTPQALSLWMAGKMAWPGDNPRVGDEYIWHFRARFKDNSDDI